MENADASMRRDGSGFQAEWRADARRVTGKMQTREATDL